MSINGIPVPGSTFLSEVTVSAVQSAAATAVTIAGQVISVNLTAHALTVGTFFTFSGVTGATGLNDQTWQVATVVDANNFTANIAVGSSVSGTPAGTIVVQRVFFPNAGVSFVTTAANARVEYSPNNGQPGIPGQTWRVLIPVSSQGSTYFDGTNGAIRVRVFSATAGNTLYSTVQ